MKKSNKNKKGISLIVLVITIIVIIILAVAVILTMANNNPIENANKASFQNDLKAMEEEVNLYESEQYAEANIEGNVYTPTTVEGESMVDMFPSTSGYEYKVKVENGELVIIETGLSEKEKEWASEIGFTIGSVSNLADLYTSVNIGDYVNYPVEYTNAYPEDVTYNGWRVVSKSDNVVRLISAGVPDKKLVHGLDGYSNSSLGDFSTYVDSNYATSAESISLKVLKEYMPDMDDSRLITAYGTIPEEYRDLLSCSVPVWLLDTDIDTNWRMRGYISKDATIETCLLAEGRLGDSPQGATYGIRPVVTLQQGLKTTGKDESGAWAIVK